jgi:hypothetical protein
VNKTIVTTLFGALASACYEGATSKDTGGIDSVGEHTGGDTDSDGDDDSGGADDGGPSDADCGGVGPRILRRLTSHQLHNTLVAIFDDAGVPEAQVLDDPVVRGFTVDAHEAVIRDLGAQQVMQYAEIVADWAVTETLPAMVPCQDHTPACHEQVVRELGAKFHREPLADTTVGPYTALMAEEASFDDALRQLVAALVQSPFFLYRRELGEPDPDDPDRYRLTDYEIASNLSYSLTNGPPDETLLGLAADGSLRDTDVLVDEVSRLVQSAGGRESLGHFVQGWLEVDDLHSRVKVEVDGVSFDEALREDMLTETNALFTHVFESDGTVADLFTADYTFANQRLGQFYGLWEATSSDHQQTTLPEDGVRAPGLLGHGSVLARHASAENSSPVSRGVLVRRRLLCGDLPDPPANVDTNLPPVPEGSSNRERYEEHSSNPDCSGCHALIDPVGFAFEHYDQFGRWRDLESNQPVDASGTLSGVSAGTIDLDGLASVGTALAELEETRACFAGYLAYYTYGLNGCDPEAIVAAAGGQEASLRAILEAIVTAPHFRQRVLGE